MKSLFVLIAAAAVAVALMVYAIVLVIKQFQSDLKAGKLAVTTVTVILASVVGTYLIALFFKNVDIIEPYFAV